MSAVLRERLHVLRHRMSSFALQWSGIATAIEALAPREGAIVLMYHSVPDDAVAPFVDPRNRMPRELFVRQMEFLKRHRSVLSLSQVVEDIQARRPLPPRTVCITFDDGYLDNLTVVAPILARLGLPATLFVATGYVERGETQWVDALYWMIQSRTVDRPRLPSLGNQGLDLGTAAGRRAARRVLEPRLLEADRTARRRLLAEIEQALAPRGRAPRLTMNWDETRELRRRYPLIEVGGHTREHVDLHAHRAACAREEIDGCAEDLRRELGTSPRQFSYPYARWCEATRAHVRATGWQCAVGMNRRIRLDASSDPFAIARIEAPRTMTELRFITGGAYPCALSMPAMDSG